MMVYATFTHFQENRQDLIPILDNYSWIPLATVIISIWARNAGIMPVIQVVNYNQRCISQAVISCFAFFLRTVWYFHEYFY